ncbi:MAG: hypothetical protein IT458_14025 [Planctomycetes bacterium]|nr:hypothetical protein [Planctomycetota bacterium]
MASPTDSRVDLLLRHFFNRTDRVAVARGGGGPCAAEAVSPLVDLVRGHILGEDAESGSVRISGGQPPEMQGRFRVGSYAPGPDGSTRWLCFDLDGPPHAAALVDPLQAALAVHQTLREQGLPSYLERSGGGAGWHLWVLFKQPVPASKARALGHALVPKGAPLVQGGCADATKCKGIEVFPKSNRVAKGGYGNMVWLPWWHGAAEGANQFYCLEDGNPVRFTPETFETVEEVAVDECLRALQASPRGASPTPGPRARGRGSRAKSDFKEWRRRALAALDLHAVYGEWLTGRSESPGWLECRDPESPSGDRDPSAGVADGTSDAEKGTFHSFRDGQSVSVFDFLVRVGTAKSFRAACGVIADFSGVPLPGRTRTLQRPAAKGSEPKSETPEIVINGRQLPEVVAEAWRAVIGAGEPRRPSVLQRSGRLVRVTPSRGIEILGEPELRAVLVRVAKWYRRSGDDQIDCTPSKVILQDMLALPADTLPSVDRIVGFPVYDRDGRLLLEPGYYAGEQLWYEPSGVSAAGLGAPERPSSEQVVQARALLEEIVHDFPFASDSDRTHFFCGLLLPLVRAMVRGPTPLLMIEAPTTGSGKSLLAKVVLMLYTGQAPPLRPWPEQEEEARKAITTMLSAGHPVHCIDNLQVHRRHSSANLAVVLTTECWADREMHSHRQVELPNQALWIATGNNPSLSDELSRRSIRCRLVPSAERPELRTDFRHPDLLGWVREQRSRLLNAGYVLVQSWIASGRPPGGGTMGSFESWVEVVGGIVQHAGFLGFLANKEQVRDPRSEALAELVEAWWQQQGDRPVAVAALAQIAECRGVLQALCPGAESKGSASALGILLQRYRDHIIGDRRIRRVEQPSLHKGASSYRLERLG